MKQIKQKTHTDIIYTSITDICASPILNHQLPLVVAYIIMPFMYSRSLLRASTVRFRK